MALPLVPIVGALAQFAPKIAGWIGGDGAEEKVGKVAEVAQAVTGADTPDEAARLMREDPDLALKFQESVNQLEVEFAREDTKRLAEVNKTMRAELGSNDKYQSRWRPTFGYAVALSWLLQMIGVTAAVLYAVVKHPAEAGEVVGSLGTLLSSTSMLWSVALGVLGISVHQRSKDKARATGKEPASLLGSVLTRFGGK